MTVSSSPQSSSFWVQSLDLRPSDESELVNGDWLSNKHINAVGKLLKKQHPNQNGFQDPLMLSPKLQRL